MDAVESCTQDHLLGSVYGIGVPLVHLQTPATYVNKPSTLTLNTLHYTSDNRPGADCGAVFCAFTQTQTHKAVKAGHAVIVVTTPSKI